MTLHQFMMNLESTEQIAAAERVNFIVDMATVASGLYAEKGANPIQKHLDALGET